jgi:RNA polymerase subunit RPABC4/transcription elongation factor Spt4
VADLSELKNNWSLWKRAKSCYLAFNQTELKVEFSIPITACNFMIELDPFYENLQASSLESLQCPRCSRYVTGKHGICSNCHENAYQWRHLSVIRNTMSFKVCCSSYSTPKERIQRWIDHDEKRTLWSYSWGESDQSRDSLIQARNHSSKSVQVAEDGQNPSLKSKLIIHLCVSSIEWFKFHFCD